MLSGSDIGGTVVYDSGNGVIDLDWTLGSLVLDVLFTP